MSKTIINANACKGQSSAQILSCYMRSDPDQVGLKGFSSDQAQKLKAEIEATGRQVTIKS